MQLKRITVEVTEDTIRESQPKTWKMPANVRRAMQDFDVKRPVSPFIFKIPARFKR